MVHSVSLTCALLQGHSLMLGRGAMHSLPQVGFGLPSLQAKPLAPCCTNVVGGSAVAMVRSPRAGGGHSLTAKPVKVVNLPPSGGGFTVN